MREEAIWEVTSDEPPGRHVLPPGTGRIIGRHGGLGADLILPVPTVARRHASLENRGGTLEIEDLGSHCGIYVNEQACRGKVALSDGDEVRVGGVVFRVRRRLGVGPGLAVFVCGRRS